MSNPCSIWSYDEIKKSGYVSRHQEMFLSVFCEEGRPLTVSEAIKLCYDKFEIKSKSHGFGSRISELEDFGFLRQAGKVFNPKTNKKVTQWEYTGATKPHESRMEFVECRHCNGKGGKVQKVYRAAPIGQTDMF